MWDSSYSKNRVSSFFFLLPRLGSAAAPAGKGSGGGPPRECMRLAAAAAVRLREEGRRERKRKTPTTKERKKGHETSLESFSLFLPLSSLFPSGRKRRPSRADPRSAPPAPPSSRPAPAKARHPGLRKKTIVSVCNFLPCHRAGNGSVAHVPHRRLSSRRSLRITNGFGPIFARAWKVAASTTLCSLAPNKPEQREDRPDLKPRRKRVAPCGSYRIPRFASLSHLSPSRTSTMANKTYVFVALALFALAAVATGKPRSPRRPSKNKRERAGDAFFFPLFFPFPFCSLSLSLFRCRSPAVPTHGECVSPRRRFCV